MNTTVLAVAGAWYALLSLVTLVAFAHDKRRAIKGRHRTAEKTLHLLELAGGWPGALLAMKLVRHKNAKAKFFLVTWAIALLHAGAWAALWWTT